MRSVFGASYAKIKHRHSAAMTGKGNLRRSAAVLRWLPQNNEADEELNDMKEALFGRVFKRPFEPMLQSTGAGTLVELVFLPSKGCRVQVYTHSAIMCHTRRLLMGYIYTQVYTYISNHKYT